MYRISGVLLLFFISLLVGCENEVVITPESTYVEGQGSQNKEKENSTIEDKSIIENYKSVQQTVTDDFDKRREIFVDTASRSNQNPELILLESLHDSNLFQVAWGHRLMFFNDGKYIYHVSRFGEYVIGDFEIIDDVNIRLVPRNAYGEGEKGVDMYYEEMTLTLRKELKDLFYSDWLVTEESNEEIDLLSYWNNEEKSYVVLPSGSSEINEYSECTLNGIEVIKTEFSAVINHRTYLKELPDNLSSNVALDISKWINYNIDHAESYNKVVESYTEEELKFFDDLNEILKGVQIKVEARTNIKSSIDNKEDYWYYITYFIGEGLAYRGWIHGGCLERYDSSKVETYVKMYHDDIASFIKNNTN